MSSSLIIEKDQFNSEMFNLNFGNITHYNKYIEKQEIIKFIDNCQFDILGIKISSRDLNAMYSFQKSGFYIVDCLVTYEYDKLHCSPIDSEFSIDFKDSINDNEVKRLAKIASDVFHFDRFHSDPNLKKELVDNYYYRWVINSFNGYSDGAIVPVVNGLPVAFTTYKLNNVDDNTSTIVLSAVDSNFTGKGVYGNMLKKTSVEILKHSRKIRIGTQVDNIPVQRTWQKLGYKLIDVKYVLHYTRKSIL